MASLKDNPEDSIKYCSESFVNKEFFDRHANIGIIENGGGNEQTRDLMQCPIYSQHRFGFRKVHHAECCSRASGVELETCDFNELHRFPKGMAAEHYRFCSTWLMIQQRYKSHFPNMTDYKDFKHCEVEPWSLKEFRARCNDRGVNPERERRLKLPDLDVPWFKRNTEEIQFTIIGDLFTDLADLVVKEAAGIDLESLEKQRKLPNFYNRRPPRLTLPVIENPNTAPLPEKKRQNDLLVKREVFDLRGWAYSTADSIDSD